MSARAYPLGPWFAHLTGGAQCLPVEVDAAFWETGVGALPPGRLVSMFESAEDWKVWECHPSGEELIIQIDGGMVLVLDRGSSLERVPLQAGEFAIVPQGVWHTADVIAPGRAIYITPGEGTQSRER
ncbi:MAG: cupin domain-containing protein [Novosphingobium sp.]|nr:cupin domain-containing protein [Novosphingobium sp.]